MSDIDNSGSVSTKRSSYHTGSKSIATTKSVINPESAQYKKVVGEGSFLGNTSPSSAFDVSSILDSVFNNISSVLAQQAAAYQQPQTPSYYVYENNAPSYEELQSLLGNLNFDLNLPDNYLQSAFDLAQYNTDQSQAMAREQMAYQTEANAKAMEFNKNEAQKTRDWVQAMSDTSHQREVTDLVAAGLNPILSANQGASTGTAANAIGSAGSGAKGTVDTQAVSVLMNAYKTAKEIEIQEKNLSLQEKMNMLNNDTNRYMADKSAAASIYNAGLTSSAARYSSELAAAANRYAAKLLCNPSL